MNRLKLTTYLPNPGKPWTTTGRSKLEFTNWVDVRAGRLDRQHEERVEHFEQRVTISSFDEAAYTRAHRASAFRVRARRSR